MNKEIEYLKEAREEHLEEIRDINNEIKELQLKCNHEWTPKPMNPWMSREVQICTECEKERWRECYTYDGVIWGDSVQLSHYPGPIKSADGWYY